MSHSGVTEAFCLVLVLETLISLKRVVSEYSYFVTNGLICLSVRKLVVVTNSLSGDENGDK